VRLPAIFIALDTGVICRSKAWLFTELCAELIDQQIQVVCERLLPDAARLTSGELAARIKKLAIALDPEWAARRYASAVQDRDVIGYLDEDGTATVTGRRLPADQAAAACARIEHVVELSILDSNPFACPECGGNEFLLTHRRPMTQQELDEAPVEVRGLLTMYLTLFSDDSPIHAHCARGCEFAPSVTDIECGRRTWGWSASRTPSLQGKGGQAAGPAQRAVLRR
jgi:hypothetical protein